MAGQKTQTTANKILDHVLGGPDLVRPATVYVGLKRAGAEITGGAYARVGTVNNSTNFPPATGGVKSSAVDISFEVASADWGEVEEAAVYDAATAGWEITSGFVGPGSVPFTAKTSDTLSAPGHSLAVDNKVRLLTLINMALPSPLVVGVTYFVKTVTAEDFTLAATQGGVAIDVLTAGGGRVGKFEPRTVQTGDQFVLKAGQLSWVEA
jgi:hypothetical protein